MSTSSDFKNLIPLIKTYGDIGMYDEKSDEIIRR